MTGLGNHSFVDYDQIKRRVRACDYLVVAQLFLRDNFLLTRELQPADIKPRLLGHWGTCHGINVAYANLSAYFQAQNNPNFHFVLGPGHGFPALQANLYYDGELAKTDPRATCNADGLAYLCKSFSWPGGYPSHSSPATPGVICEGGELGYALATAYGAALGHPERTYAVLIGDGELETATALASLNLNQLLATEANGTVLPVLHLNGYKISAPTISGRKSERQLHQQLRGFGFTPIEIPHDTPHCFQAALQQAAQIKNPFLILRSAKGETGPAALRGRKIAGTHNAHQIPLPAAAEDPEQLQLLADWLHSYHFTELFDPEKGVTL